MLLYKLPPEVREHIYSKCDSKSLSNFSCCSSTLHDDVKPQLWKTVQIPWSVLRDEDFTLHHNLRKLSNLKHTSYLIITYFIGWDGRSGVVGSTPMRPKHPNISISYKRLIQYCDPSVLQRIHMDEYHCDVDGECAGITCERFPNLKKLKIHDADSVPPQVGFAICGLKFLTVLDLNFTHTTDEMLLAISQNCVNLTYLDVYNSQVLRDYGFSKISNLRLLETLIMGHNNITSEALSYMDGLTNLKRFHCSRTMATHCTSLKKLTSLEVMNFENTRLEDVDFIDADVALKNIKSLILVNHALTDEGIKYIARMVTLVKLDISVTFLSDEGIPHLAQLTSLQELNIADTFITDVGITWIKGMELKSLDISNTPITDNGLEYVREMKTLTYFACWDIKMTDAGVRSIGKLESLENLRVNGAGDVLTCKGLIEGLEPLKGLQKVNVLRCYRHADEFEEFCQNRGISFSSIRAQTFW